MDKLEDRYLSPQIVMANRFVNYPKPDWKIAILCFRDFIGCDAIVKCFNAKPLDGFKVFYGIDAHETKNQVFECEINEVKIGIITRLSWGGPQAAILVEELSYLGVQYVIGYGAAGSINMNFNKGDLVIGTKSLVTDGTSYTYKNDKKSLHCSDELLLITKEETSKPELRK
ncbi:phosphorylase family protein [Paenibacillus sp. strain BS8-2]